MLSSVASFLTVGSTYCFKLGDDTLCPYTVTFNGYWEEGGLDGLDFQTESGKTILVDDRQYSAFSRDKNVIKEFVSC